MAFVSLSTAYNRLQISTATQGLREGGEGRVSNVSIGTPPPGVEEPAGALLASTLDGSGTDGVA